MPSSLTMTALSSTEQRPPSAPTWGVWFCVFPEVGREPPKKKRDYNSLICPSKETSKTQEQGLAGCVNIYCWAVNLSGIKHSFKSSKAKVVGDCPVKTGVGFTLSWVFLERDGTGRKSRPPGIWQTNEGHVGEWNKTDQEAVICTWKVSRVQHGKSNRHIPLVECKSATPENKGAFGQGNNITTTSKAQLMAHSQRIRSGAALRPSLSSGSSNHIESWLITTLQDSNLYYNHHNFLYPNQKNYSMEPLILPNTNSLATFKAANLIQRQNKQILFLFSTNRAQKNHTQVKTLNISVKAFPFSESQDNTDSTSCLRNLGTSI